MNPIVEKIQKLLSLATSSNENEARLAASKAQELLVKHNLTMSEVERKATDYVKEEFNSGAMRQPKEIKMIIRLLTRFFFVDVITHRVVVPGQSRRTIKLVMLGKPHNIAIAKYVGEFLEKAFKDLWIAHRASTGCPLASKDSFFLGLYQGLTEQLMTTQVQVQQQVGLMVVEDQGLVNFTKQVFPRLSSSSLKVNDNDQDARNAGKERGKNLNIARGLSSKSSNLGRLLK